MVSSNVAAENISIRDIPLKPWTGFARSWDWTYDALHKLVLSGIAGKVVLNTKPMSRREMALILADIIQRIQENRVSEFDQRYDLQDILLELMDEFSPELLALGVTGYGIRGEPPRFLEVKPLQFLQVRGGYTSNAPTDLENSNGERLEQGLNARVAGASWVEAGGVLAAYAHPEFLIGPDHESGRLVEGYLKARGGFLEMLAGRQPLWWGPGFHGSMLFSNNALGLDMVRLQTANQIELPWLLRYLGPLKFQGFFGQFEAEREFPHAKITGVRVDLAPFPWLELGAARSIMFAGKGRPKLNAYEWPRVLVFGNRTGSETSKYTGDNRFQVDLSLRFADVGKYLPLTRDAEFYIDFGWDDTCCGTFYAPLKPGAIVGLYLPNLFMSPDTTFRVEYSNSSSFQFTHSIWRDGYVRKGHVLSDFEGTAGEDLFFRLTERLDKQLEVGIEFDLARRGRTEQGLAFATKELHRYVGVDVSYRHSKNLSLNFATRFEWVRNRDFVAGNNDVNQVYTMEATYAFDTTYGAGRRGGLPPEELRRVPPETGARDPDQIVSWNYGVRVAEDAWSILKSPLRWDARDWLIAGGVAAATGGAMLLDHEIRQIAQRNQGQTAKDVADGLKYFGHAVPAGILAMSYLGGQITGNETAKRVAADGVEASLLSNVMFVYPMKFLLGRTRPSAERGSQEYRPFNIGGSLPSFHTVEAFTVASVIAEHLDNPWVSALAYGLAGGLGLSRIHSDRHWASDVVLSAAIGTAVGKAVVSLNRQRRDSRVSVIPLADGEMWGAAVQVKY